ncbi:MAG TPA: low specificity L-threonine aldolase [Terriglobales bacterium]|nr:low specificity L-threonine aldolase [Terriglobales bacterium]
MKPVRSFASDNNAGVHPEILKAIASVNQGHVVGYGDDPYTQRAVDRFHEHFGSEIEVFFVFNGTAANVLSLKALTESYHAVICSEAAHIYTDECGAPEKFTGCKLLPISTTNGKLTVEKVAPAYHGIGDQHHVQPHVISLTQSTEMGTLYKPQEIRALADFAHERGMFLHMDGARISNAAAALGQTLRQATRDLGVDVLSFGGTKNGLLGAEAVVFFGEKLRQEKRLAESFLFLRKQGMQLASKMRFIAAQMETLLTGDLWRKNAEHANAMAQLLQQELQGVPQVKIVYPVEANGVFAQLPQAIIPKLQERYFFYVWNEEQGVVRWMCSFDTTEQDIREFVQFIRETLQS